MVMTKIEETKKVEPCVFERDRDRERGQRQRMLKNKQQLEAIAVHRRYSYLRFCEGVPGWEVWVGLLIDWSDP